MCVDTVCAHMSYYRGTHTGHTHMRLANGLDRHKVSEEYGTDDRLALFTAAGRYHAEQGGNTPEAKAFKAAWKAARGVTAW
jgi:hypothetical protein